MMTFSIYPRGFCPVPLSAVFRPALATAASLSFALISVLIPALIPVGPAHAEGLYLGGGAGLNMAADADVTGTGVDTSIDFDPGPVAMIAAGYAFDNGFRSELELAGRWNDAETVGGSSGAGDTTAISGMVNVLYDFAIGDAFSPYVGAGLGAAQIEDSGVASINGSSISDDDTVFAYQAMAGLSYDLGNFWSLTADYRYFASDDVSLTTASSVAVEQEYASHSLLIGLRFDFGGSSRTMPEAAGETAAVPSSGSSYIAETPAPDAAMPAEPDAMPEAVAEEVAESAVDADEAALTQVAAAPAAPGFPRAYRILFDWDKSILNPLALNTIAAIAMNASEGEIIRIRAIGHADRSGAEDYNASLSRRRAEEVMKALIRLGIPENHIEIDWRGEREPVVETEDGVRHPDNRRVEIVFPAN